MVDRVLVRRHGIYSRNGLCRFRRQDVNMASTWECSRNDVISNVGVLAAAGLVAATSSPWPDILIGLAMAAVVLRSAVRVLRDAERRGGFVKLTRGSA